MYLIVLTIFFQKRNWLKQLMILQEIFKYY